MGLLRKVLRGAGSLRDSGDSTTPKIIACDAYTEIAEESFTWDEIDAVRAYKIDLVTTDEIRILVGFVSSERLLELSEEQEGFEAFIRIAEPKLSFPEGWWERLVKPAFDKCETTLFRR